MKISFDEFRSINEHVNNLSDDAHKMLHAIDPNLSFHRSFTFNNAYEVQGLPFLVKMIYYDDQNNKYGRPGFIIDPYSNKDKRPSTDIQTVKNELRAAMGR